MAPPVGVVVTRPPPTKDQWLSLRPEIACWYLQKHRTAGWITKELRARGLVVTNKMLRDRFREWQFPLKYNRVRQNESRRELPRVDADAAVSNAMSTSSGDMQLTGTLSVIGHYLDALTDSGSWRSADVSQGLEMQRLAARAHITIATYGFDCPARYTELLDLGNQVALAMTRCVNASIMHPRVLAVILRLLVDNCATAIESSALTLVRRMFQILSHQMLPHQHPLRLLCHMNKEQAPALMKRLLLLTESRFYDKISPADPVYAAREQTYSARVLASLGRTDEAITLLTSTLGKFDGQIDAFTMADVHRTLGYAKVHAGVYDEAKFYSTLALQGFAATGESSSENAMYAHMCLVQVYRQCDTFHNLSLAEEHASASLEIWESNAPSNHGKGGIRLVKDLHEIMMSQGKYEEAQALCRRYPTYFGAGE